MFCEKCCESLPQDEYNKYGGLCACCWEEAQELKAIEEELNIERI